MIKKDKKNSVSEYPNEWQVVSLGMVSLNFLGGGTPSTSNPVYWNGDIPWMTSAHINGKEIKTGQKHISKKGLENSASNIIPKNNLLVATRVGIGKATLNEIDVAISQDLTGVIVDKNKAIPSFLYWALIKNESRLKALAQGSTIKGILKDELARFNFPLPPLSEQQRIAEVLSCVDDVIQIVDKSIAKTERLKKGLMNKLLTEGIGHVELKETKIGKIPKTWEIKRISDVCKVVTGGTPSTKHPEYFGGDIKWLKSGDIKQLHIYDTKEKITQLGIENSNARIHPANSVAIALSGRGQTRGRTAIIKEPMACSQSVAFMIPNSEILPEYLHYNLSHRYLEIRNLTGNLDRSGLNLSIVRDIQVPIPSLDEQEKMSSVLLAVDHKFELEIERKEKLERVKKGMMNDLLTGRRRVKVAM